MKLIKKGVMLGLILLCMACGFHLRGYKGDYQVRYKNLYIACNNNNAEVCDLLKSTIINQKLTTVAEARTNASYILELVNAQDSKTPVSLNQYGRISAYKLTYSVTIRILDKDNKQIFGDKVISFSREMIYNDSLVLSSQAQEQNSWEDIHQNVMDIILHNLTRINQ